MSESNTPRYTKLQAELAKCNRASDADYEYKVGSNLMHMEELAVQLELESNMLLEALEIADRGCHYRNTETYFKVTAAITAAKKARGQ